jgi:hypothetical protein
MENRADLTINAAAEPQELALRLRQLRGRLLACGYAEFVSAFNPFCFSSAKWTTCRNLAFPEIRGLIDFLLLNKRAHQSYLDGLLGETWRVLLGMELAEELEGGWARLKGLSLWAYLGYLVFIDTPKPDLNVYFGDDTIGLFARLHAMPGEHCLDLCSGSGIQALHCSSFAGSVDAVEINPLARQVLWCNVLLNGRHDRIQVWGGSLYDELPENRQYDLVVANPPLVPFPEELDYPFVGHGGIDGFAVTRKIIQGLPEHLSETGRAQIIGLTLADDEGDLVIEGELAELARTHDLVIRVTVLNRFPLDPSSPFFRGLVSSSQLVSPQAYDEIAARLAERLRRLNATHAAPYVLHITRSGPKGKGKVVYQNFSRVNPEGLWFV